MGSLWKKYLAQIVEGLSRRKSESHDNTGGPITDYVLKLAEDETSIFHGYVDDFISVTLDIRGISPQEIMRNMRNFMDMIKKYLRGLKEVDTLVEQERKKLQPNAFLDLNKILETVLHKLVLTPLRDNLYKAFVGDYTRRGSLQKISENILNARCKTPKDLGLTPYFIQPDEKAMDKICNDLRKIQDADSPMDKLDNLLAAVDTIIEKVTIANIRNENWMIESNDFPNILTWAFVESKMVEIEIEAEYIWGLMDQTYNTGEVEYFLMSLFCAVLNLKNIR